MKVAPPPGGDSGPLGPLQIVAPGLTGLLQLKQLGRLPDKLADTVAGVIELRDWYLTARRLGSTALFGVIPTKSFTTAAGNGFFQFGAPNAVIPQGQIWYIEQMTIFTTIAVAADYIRLSAGMAQPGFETFVLGPDFNDIVTARTGRVLTSRAERGFWAFPGDVLGAIVHDIVQTGAITGSLEIRATPCQL